MWQKNYEYPISYTEYTMMKGKGEVRRETLRMVDCERITIAEVFNHPQGNLIP